MKQDNLYRIRYYGHRYDPREFKVKGWRGWWIWLLNELRFKLELRVMRQVLVFQAKRLGNIVDLNAALDTFESDVRAVRQHVATTAAKPAPAHTGSVLGHTKELRQAKVESLRDITARVMNNYAADPRQRRYALGRRHRVMMEADTPSLQEISNAQADTESGFTHSIGQQGEPFRAGRARPVHPEYAAEILSTEAESPLAAERIQSIRAASRHRDIAHATTQHQRRVLSRSERAFYDVSSHAHQRADDAGEERPKSTEDESEKYRATESGENESPTTGTETRPSPVEHAH